MKCMKEVVGFSYIIKGVPKKCTNLKITCPVLRADKATDYTSLGWWNVDSAFGIRLSRIKWKLNALWALEDKIASYAGFKAFDLSFSLWSEVWLKSTKLNTQCCFSTMNGILVIQVSFWSSDRVWLNLDILWTKSLLASNLKGLKKSMRYESSDYFWLQI